MNSLPFFVTVMLLPCTLCNPMFGLENLGSDFIEDSLVSELNISDGQKDESHILQFTAFAQKYTMMLEPADSIFAPNFQIKTTSNITIEDYKSKSLNGRFYVEKNGKGSFYVDIVDGIVQMDAIVNDQVRIWNENGVHKAYRVQNDYIPDAFANDQVNIKAKHGSFQHKDSCFETVAPEPESTTQAEPESTTQAEPQPNTHSSNLPEVVTVEVYAVVNADLHKVLQKRKIPVQKYLGLLWNAVQNKYKTTHEPRIEFAITGCMLLPDMDWIQSTIVGPNTVDSHKLIENFGKWLYGELNSVTNPHYDIAIMHIGLDLASNDEGGQYNPSTLGVAYTGGVCIFETGGDMIYSCGLMEDLDPSLKFQGIITVAHEVAHLFGAPHDNSEPASEHCPVNYIMYYAVGPDTVEQFSECSLRRIRAHLSKEQSACVRDPVKATSIPMLTPEETEPNSSGIDPNDLCTERLGKESKADEIMFQFENPCETLFCKTSQFFSQAIFNIPDGLICGKNKKCIKKVCQ